MQNTERGGDERAKTTEPATSERSEEREVVDLDAPLAREPEIVGNKAARLAQLRGADFQVPPGIVVTAEWYAEHAGSDSRETARAVEELLESEIERIGEGPFAVRSSGVDEDGDVESMAGQYHTELEVEPAQVPEAVVRCMERDAHLEREGDETSELAVLIQPMVAADSAGVAFSRDPVTGYACGRISAVEGLGDELVAGNVEGED